MVARVNGGVATGQVLVGSLSHFTLTFKNNSAAAVNLSGAPAHAVDGSLQRVLEAIAVKSTVVMHCLLFSIVQLHCAAWYNSCRIHILIFSMERV